jgi:hypothetical protein
VGAAGAAVVGVAGPAGGEACVSVGAVGLASPESAAALVGCIHRSRYVWVPGTAVPGFIAKPRWACGLSLLFLAVLGRPASALPLPLSLLAQPASLGGRTKAVGVCRSGRLSCMGLCVSSCGCGVDPDSVCGVVASVVLCAVQMWCVACGATLRVALSQ